MRASAPGKLFLLGEYAVLAGARALVAAVDRRVVGSREALARRRFEPSPIVRAVLDKAGVSSMPLDIDSSRLYDDRGNKLGLGSSAAVAVVAAALVSGRSDRAAFDLALDAHRAAAGGVGSGLDVAASFCGGVIAAGRQPSPIERLDPSVPGGLLLTALYTGSSAKTPDLVKRVQAAPDFAAWSRDLGALAERGIDAWKRRDASSFLAAVGEYGEKMRSLGEHTGTPIVTGPIAELMRRAREAGAAAKPSGAGGGDVAIVLAADPALAGRLGAEVGATPVPLAIDPIGLSTP